jgi:hypothetical protein
VGNLNDVILISKYGILIVCLQKTGSGFSRDFTALFVAMATQMIQCICPLKKLNCMPSASLMPNFMLVDKSAQSTPKRAL